MSNRLFTCQRSEAPKMSCNGGESGRVNKAVIHHSVSSASSETPPNLRLELFSPFKCLDLFERAGSLVLSRNILRNMASRRSLGGGRILGSGQSLSPSSAASRPQQQLSNSYNSSLLSPGGLSPSASSVSLSSQASSTPISTQDEDIRSRVALVGQGPTAVASASSKLLCPICGEEMMTLLQLNR